MYVLCNCKGNFYGKNGKPTNDINKALKFQKRKGAKDNASTKKNKNIDWKIREV